MNNDQREYFTSQVDKLFNIMNDMSMITIDGIKQLDDDIITHDVQFVKRIETYDKYYIYHRVYHKFDFLRREFYTYHPKSKKKFYANIYIFDPAKWKLFDRWSKIDVEGMLRKIDLKIVELI